MKDPEKLTIKDWSESDRPREKMLQNGISKLTNAELIGILIGSGNATESAVELGRRILNAYDNQLNTIEKQSVDQLTKFKGIGTAKAINIITALELGKRLQFSEHKQQQKITCSEDAYKALAYELSGLDYEEFWVLYLDRSNRIIAKTKISQGGVSGTVIDVRLILKTAIEKLASGMILAHNHPSGNLTSSTNDLQITKKIKSAAEVMDMKILDHIIVAGKKYHSFADEGIL